MGTFRELSSADVQEILAAFGQPAYRAHSPISAGTINTNFAVDTSDGRRFLRVNEGKAREDVEREAAIVAHAAARGVPTPPPFVARSGTPFLFWRDVHVSLFPWLPGRTLGRLDVGPGHARQLGAALARLHLAGVDFPDRRPGRYEPNEIQRRFQRIRQDVGGDPALAAAVEVLGPELAAVAAERAAPVPMGLIHADLFIDNVLYDDAGGLVALLDFEQASWGRLPYDLAVSTLAFGYGRDDFRPDVTRALLEGYAEVRRPSEDERAVFGAELRFAACRFAVTRITDVYLRRGQGAPGGKDFRRYLQRLASVKARLAAGDGLLTLP